MILIRNKKEEWNLLIRKYTDLLFYSLEWYEALKMPWNKNIILEDESAVLPLQLNVLNRKAYSGPWGSYGGPLGNLGNPSEFFSKVKKSLKIRELTIYSTRYIETGNKPEIKNAILIPLKDKDHNFKILSENRKRNLKKALNSNFELDIMQGKNAAIRYLRLLKKSKNRKSYSFHTYALFKKIATLKETFFFFCKGKEDLSAILLLKLNSGTLYFWHGVSTEKGLENHAMDFIHWQVVLYGLKEGFKEYNMGTSPTESLEQYKKSWGGVLKPIYVYTV
jgi:hypothetical protein